MQYAFVHKESKQYIFNEINNKLFSNTIGQLGKQWLIKSDQHKARSGSLYTTSE